MQIDLNIEKAIQQSGGVGEFVINRVVEDKLVQLLDMRDQLLSAISRVEEELGEALLRENPIHKSVTGLKVRFSMRAYGPKYSVDASEADKGLFYFGKPRCYPKTKEIDSFIEENNRFPEGVAEVSRVLKPKLELLKEKNEEV